MRHRSESCLHTGVIQRWRLYGASWHQQKNAPPTRLYVCTTRRFKSLEHSYRRRYLSIACCVPSLPKDTATNRQQLAILPSCLPAADGPLFERRTNLSHTPHKRAVLDLAAIGRGCDLWARRPWPQLVLTRSCCF